MNLWAVTQLFLCTCSKLLVGGVEFISVKWERLSPVYAEFKAFAATSFCLSAI